MITLNEFIYLANRSSKVFLETMAGSGLNKTVHNKRAWDEATHAYSKLNPGNGRVDDIQLRALAHGAELHKAVWRAFREQCCKPVKSWGPKSSIVTKCSNHGEPILCHKTFEDWIKRNSY